MSGERQPPSQTGVQLSDGHNVRSDDELDDLELTIKSIKPPLQRTPESTSGIAAGTDVEEDTVQRLSTALSTGDIDHASPATEQLPLVAETDNHDGSSTHGAESAPDEASDASNEADDTSNLEPGRRTHRGEHRYSRNRMIWGAAVLATLCLGIGFAVRPLIVSPADAAARAAAPQAQAIAVPVEERAVASVVTTRADVTYEDPVDVVVEAGGSVTPMVVTGALPNVGAEVDAGTVLLNVAGRPVLALPGAIPTYRSLGAGMSGPDVLQLKAALTSLGIAVGNPSSDSYDGATAAAVRQLYARVGYEAPQPTKEESDALTQAQRAVPAAQKDLADAHEALDKATLGLPSADRIALDNDVNAAQRALDEALVACVSPPITADGPACSQSAIDGARDQLRLAEARRADALSAPDTSAQWAAVVSASDALSQARADVAKAQEAALTKFPSSELVFVKTLPRRVDTVNASVGQTLGTGAAMTLSGATVQLVANVAARDAELLTPGMIGSTTVLGADIPVTLVTVEKKKTEGSDTGQTKDTKSGTRYTVTFSADALTPGQLEATLGTNIRVKVPIEATDGKVLAVPVAALTAGPGGESRVELVTGTRDGQLTTELVTVETGITADGYAEITNSSKPLSTSDRVVVGR